MGKKTLIAAIICLFVICSAAALGASAKKKVSLGPTIVSSNERLVFDRPISSRILAHLEPTTSGNVPRYFGRTKDGDLKISPFSKGSPARLTVSAKTRAWQSLSPITHVSATLKPTETSKTVFANDRYQQSYESFKATKESYIAYNRMKKQALANQGRIK